MRRGSALLYLLVAVLILAGLALPLSLLQYMNVQRMRYELASVQALYLAEAAVLQSIAQRGDGSGIWYPLTAGGQVLGTYRYDAPLTSGTVTTHIGYGRTQGGPLNFGLQLERSVRARVQGGQVVGWEVVP